MTTFKEDGGSCTAQAQWNPTAGTVEVQIEYSVHDWKERLPCPQIPVEGRPDLVAECGLGATFGQEEYWGVNPVTGLPVIDYGAVFGTLSAGLIDKSSQKSLLSSLQLQMAVGETTQSNEVENKRSLSTGLTSEMTFPSKLSSVSNRPTKSRRLPR